MIDIGKETGMISIAVKNPYYGRMAYNLCATVKASEPEMKFILIADDKGIAHLSAHQKELFTDIIKVDNGVEHGVSLKLRLLELSPFHRTIFVDADTIWIPSNKPSKMLSEIPDDCDFTAITEGYFDYGADTGDISTKYTFWADLGLIKDAYEITDGVIYQWRSELMVFQKNEITSEIFSLAKKIYNDPKIGFLKFVNGVPDELCFNIAALLLNIKPHKFRWNPTFWTGLYGARIPGVAELISNGYYVISCGGTNANAPLKNNYNRLVKFAMNKIGRQHIFELLPKREFLKDRKTQ